MGLGSLQNLSLDFNLLTDLSPLSQLIELRRLSFDGPRNADVIAGAANLIFPVLGGGYRGLEFLSLDSRSNPGLSRVSYYYQGKLYVSEAGVYNFSATGVEYYSELQIDSTYVYGALPDGSHVVHSQSR